jgi:phenylacetate 2-hydroxylase
MALQVVAVAVVAAIFLVIKVLSRTDTPKIKGLPEVPGIPIFGNLLQFGSEHARVAEQLSKKWGPVFQVRFGNKVSISKAYCMHIY